MTLSSSSSSNVQVANLTLDSSSSSCDSSSSSSRRSGDLPALESLTIQSVSLLSRQQTCSALQPFPIPNTLKHLATPLPGQKDRHGEVVCSFTASHEGYVRDLAALEGLESLRLLGAYEGGTQIFGQMQQLSELVVGVGGALRCAGVNAGLGLCRVFWGFVTVNVGTAVRPEGSRR
jgi:hypothetical protein